MSTKLEQMFTKDEIDGLWKIGEINAKIQWYNHMLVKAIQLLKQMEFSGAITEYEGMYDGSLETWETTKVCPMCKCQGYHSDLCELQELLKEAEDGHVH